MGIIGIVGVSLKVVGVVASVVVASNFIAYRKFCKEYLPPIDPPTALDQSQPEDVLATFEINKHEDEGGFFFGLATAPAHVEDKLDDAWLEFAQGKEDPNPEPKDEPIVCNATVEDPKSQFNPPNKGKKKLLKGSMEAMIRNIHKFVDTEEEGEEESHNVAAWHNAYHPAERLRFWSDPDAELRLAKDTGVTVFRMGVDWTRIMPVEPIHGIQTSVNWGALKRYKWIIERVHEHGMRVMLTLFHHSLPPWAGAYGGWKLEKTVNYFLEFTRLAVENFAGLVDYWITFNEPHVFAMLTYCAGAWPGGHPDLIEVATAILPMGVFSQVMHWMAMAHSKAFDHIHEFCKNASLVARVGIAHHASFMRPYGLFDVSAAVLSIKMTLFPYVDSICDKLDFLGINYYGQEVVSAPGLKLVDNDEYSESGRAVYPDGLYQILLNFNERYKHLNLPFIITENGVSDATDLIRRPYILEHLLAVRAAMDKGVPVLGYVFWTISDNWEWADGYGPKFGLVAVDRANNLARIPRPSYFLFSEVAKTGKVTQHQRDTIWNELQNAAEQGKTRPFYRATNKHGLMFAGGLDVPIQRSFIKRDWRFGHYQVDPLKDPLSRTGRFCLAFVKSPGYRVYIFLAFCILFGKMTSFAGIQVALPYFKAQRKENDFLAISAEQNEENLQPARVF